MWDHCSSPRVFNLVSNSLAKRLPFYYGYVMAPIAMMMQIGTSPGQTFAVSAFTPALLESLDLSQGRLALAYMLGTLLAAVPLGVIGPWSDRWGLRRVSLLVIVGLGAACFWASHVRGFLGLFVAFFLLRFLGQGALSLLGGNTASMWFRNKLGRVSALISIGTAAAFAWVPEWLTDSIHTHGWRVTYQCVGLILVAGLTPCILLLFRNRPEELGQVLDGEDVLNAERDERIESRGASELNRRASRQAMARVHDTETVVCDDLTLGQARRTWGFFILAATQSLWALVGTGIVFYLFTLCEDRGYEATTAPSLFKSFGLSMLVAQVVGSVLADYQPPHRLLGIGTGLLTLGVAAIAFLDSVSTMHLFALAFGAGQGVLIAVMGVVWVKFYGRMHLGSIRGAVWCVTVAGSGCGPLIMGTLKDATGHYEAALLAFFAMLSPVAIATWFVRAPRETALPAS
ncbi:MAG: MFS transporter [Planctomycetota bacterium]